MNMPFLSVRKLHTFFTSRDESVHAVRGVSFTMDQGEIVGIVGESGSGKTALAKSILRINDKRYSSTPTGDVFFNGVDLLSLSEKEMNSIRGNEIAMIFQDPMACLNPTMRIGEQIIEGALTHNKFMPRATAIDRALKLLTQVGIDSPEERFMMYPHELSGGMRQRVMIATAMICQPQLLIADEPTTALDVTIQKQILELLKSLETSILLITHDLGVVSQICSRVIVMYGGTIVEDAPVNELFLHPKHPYTKRLLESIPTLDQQSPLKPIEGKPPELNKHEKGCPFFPRCDQPIPLCRQIPPELMECCENHKVSCHLHQPKISEMLK